MNLVTVVIPIYKDHLSSDDSLSLEQCCKILGRHPITLIAPIGLQIDTYKVYFDKYQISYSVLFFDAKYFDGLEGYNELLLSISFYKKFVTYEYILIYQLDAFVFKDELEYWCLKGYDYIGAPWFKRIWRFKYSKHIRGIGNGGFSLRKVESCIRVLEYKGEFKPMMFLFSFHNSVLLKLKKLSLKRWYQIQFQNSVDFFVFINMRTEDQFWCLDTQDSYVNFEVAPVEEGIRFAFECHPSYLYQLNGKTLPFGCHAWKRYEPEFWKTYINFES